MPHAQICDCSVPSPGHTGLHRSVGLILRKLKNSSAGGVEWRGLVHLARVGPLEGGNINGSQGTGGQTKPKSIGIRRNVVANVIVGTAEPEARPFATRIRRGPAVAASRSEISRAFDTQSKVMV